MDTWLKKFLPNNKSFYFFISFCNRKCTNRFLVVFGSILPSSSFTLICWKREIPHFPIWSIREVCIWITTFMLLLVNNVAHFLYGIVYQQQYKNRDFNQCYSDGSSYFPFAHFHCRERAFSKSLDYKGGITEFFRPSFSKP